LILILLPDLFEVFLTNYGYLIDYLDLSLNIND
jgi:hypothetical protein